MSDKWSLQPVFRPGIDPLSRDSDGQGTSSVAADIDILFAYSCGHSDGDTPRRNISKHHCIGANDGAVPYSNVTKYFSTRGDKDVVFDLGNIRLFVSPSNGDAIRYKNIPPNFCSWMYDDPESPVAELKPVADLGLIEDVAMEDDKVKLYDNSRQQWNSPNIKPPCQAVVGYWIEYTRSLRATRTRTKRMVLVHGEV